MQSGIFSHRQIGSPKCWNYATTIWNWPKIHRYWYIRHFALCRWWATVWRDWLTNHFQRNRSAQRSFCAMKIKQMTKTIIVLQSNVWISYNIWCENAPVEWSAPSDIATKCPCRNCFPCIWNEKTKWGIDLPIKKQINLCESEKRQRLQLVVAVVCNHPTFITLPFDIFRSLSAVLWTAIFVIWNTAFAAVQTTLARFVAFPTKSVVSFALFEWRNDLQVDKIMERTLHSLLKIDKSFKMTHHWTFNIGFFLQHTAMLIWLWL